MKRFVVQAFVVFAAARCLYGQSGCSTARPLMPEYANCVDSPHGAAFAADASDAKQLSIYAAEGEARFMKYFGKATPQYVVVEGSLAPGVDKQLRTGGFPLVLRWFTAAQYNSGLEASVRKQIRAQSVQRGWTPQQTSDAESQAIEQLSRLNRGGKGLRRDPTAIPHELGHKWYTQTFWPSFVNDNAREHYGPGPDWLNETAAILMEDDDTTAQRRSQLQQATRDNVRLGDLASFLQRTHPMTNSEARLSALEAGGPSLTVISGDSKDEAMQTVKQASLFYAQCCVLADFLVAASGDPAIFGNIATAVSGGQTFEEWLRLNGPRERLPSSIPALQGSFEAWSKPTTQRARRPGPPLRTDGVPFAGA